jgi:hypothetical protein
MRDRMQTHRIPRNFLVYGKVGGGSMWGGFQAKRASNAQPKRMPTSLAELPSMWRTTANNAHDSISAKLTMFVDIH